MEVYSYNNKMLSVNGKCISPKASGETWVLNETGTIPFDFDYSIAFISNNQNFDRIHYHGLKILYDTTEVTSTLDKTTEGLSWLGAGQWTDQAYRTITFLEAPTGELLTWLQNNGVKQ